MEFVFLEQMGVGEESLMSTTGCALPDAALSSLVGTQAWSLRTLCPPPRPESLSKTALNRAAGSEGMKQMLANGQILRQRQHEHTTSISFGNLAKSFV